MGNSSSLSSQASVHSSTFPLGYVLAPSDSNFLLHGRDDIIPVPLGRRPFGQRLHIVVEHQMRKQHFQLGAGEEATRTARLSAFMDITTPGYL